MENFVVRTLEILGYLGIFVVIMAVFYFIGKWVDKSYRGRYQKPFEIKKGDVLVDRRFDGTWNMVEIDQVSEDGERCLYRKHIIKGEVQDCTKLHESGIEYFQYNYKKAE